MCYRGVAIVRWVVGGVPGGTYRGRWVGGYQGWVGTCTPRMSLGPLGPSRVPDTPEISTEGSTTRMAGRLAGLAGSGWLDPKGPRRPLGCTMGGIPRGVAEPPRCRGPVVRSTHDVQLLSHHMSPLIGQMISIP